jgi:putative flippase GtrA
MYSKALAPNSRFKEWEITIYKAFRSRIFDPKWRLIRFILVGGWNAGFSLGLFYLIVFTAGPRWYQLALFCTFVASTCQSYATQKIFVWRTKRIEVREFMHFFLVCLAQYVINAAVLLLLVDGIHLSPKLMQLPVSFSIALGSYIYFKKRVFLKERKVTK